MNTTSSLSSLTIPSKRSAKSQDHGTDYQQLPFLIPDSLHCSISDAEYSAPFYNTGTSPPMASHQWKAESSQSYARNDFHRAIGNGDPIGAVCAPDSMYPLSSAKYVMAASSSVQSPLPHNASGPPLEPLMMFVDHESPPWDTCQSYTMNSSTFMLGNTYETGHHFSDFIITDEAGSCYDNSHPASEVSMSSPGDDVEDPTDKPYARLIYEALMQAPGRRMMLREIYDWFIRNTNKAQGSSSNGWQNSIRHNLSMNQAFENDRSEQGNCGHSKKANSLWYLTDEAITNGVQSTTRFRKSGPAKRSLKQRANQVQRQKSGAKGGKATKRAVMLKRRCEVPTRDRLESSSSTFTSRQASEQIENPPYATSHPVDRPLTPADDLLYNGVQGIQLYDQYSDVGRSEIDGTMHVPKIGLHDYPMTGLHDDFIRTSTQEFDFASDACLKYEDDRF